MLADADRRLDEMLARTTASPEELLETAAQQRRLAAVSSIPAQRDELLAVADRYEQTARSRAAAG